MRKWLALGGLAVVLWMVLVVRWATVEWSDTQQLATPEDAELEYVTFTCSPVFDAAEPGELDGQEPTHALTREPCNRHDSRRVVAIADLVIGAGIGVGLVTAARRTGRDSTSPTSITA